MNSISGIVIPQMSCCKKKNWSCLQCDRLISKHDWRKSDTEVAVYCDCCKHQFVCTECYKTRPSFDYWAPKFGRGHSVKDKMSGDSHLSRTLVAMFGDNPPNPQGGVMFTTDISTGEFLELSSDGDESDSGSSVFFTDLETGQLIELPSAEDVKTDNRGSAATYIGQMLDLADMLADKVEPEDEPEDESRKPIFLEGSDLNKSYDGAWWESSKSPKSDPPKKSGDPDLEDLEDLDR